ncbi:MAG TPA: type IV toxin-antitoxin system AbiEi family antitoxin domain-containing protein [Acidimicrobiales bacterium]
MELDAAIQRLAAKRHGIITRHELMLLGLTTDQIKRRIRLGLLIRLHAGVYAVAGAPQTFERRVVAACLAAGDGAAVSHRSAARVWGLRGAATERVELTVPRARRPDLVGAAVHRSLVLAPVDLRVHQGITVTRPERTLVDVAGVVPADAATSMFESAVHLGLTTPEHVWRYLSRYGGPGCRGAGRIRSILEARGPAVAPTESALEDLALRVLFRGGAPAPVRQYVIRVPGRPEIRVDLAYPPIRLALEVDSARWHSDSESYRRDRAKWNLLVALGWTLLILTDFDLDERPDGVVADVLAAHGRLMQAA